MKPPEQEKGKDSDSRLDVWYLGVCSLILYSNDKNIMNFTKEYWSIASTVSTSPEDIQKNLQYISIEGLKFAEKMLKFDFRERPFSHDLLKDDYWKIDLKSLKTLGDIMKENKSAVSRLSFNKKGKLMFDTKKPNFDEFYSFAKQPLQFTKENNYRSSVKLDV